MSLPTLAIYYHSPCADGHAAAWAIKSNIIYHEKYSGNEAKYNIVYIPSVPGCPTIDMTQFTVANSEAWFLDLMPTYDLLREVCAKCIRVVVLDHHKTNQDICDRINAENNRLDTYWAHNLEIVFDMNKAGCQIAWDWITRLGDGSSRDGITHLDDGSSRPWFIEYIADRDLWRWKLPNSKLINNALFGLKLTITPDAINNKLAPIQSSEDQAKFIKDKLLPYAIASEEFNNNLLQTASNRAVKCTMKVPGHDTVYNVWLCTTINTLISDLGNQLCNKLFINGNKPDCVAIWTYDFTANEWWISLRSLDTGANVAEIAKQFNGGGHVQAAGFTLHSPTNLHSIFTHSK